VRDKSPSRDVPLESRFGARREHCLSDAGKNIARVRRLLTIFRFIAIPVRIDLHQFQLPGRQATSCVYPSPLRLQILHTRGNYRPQNQIRTISSPSVSLGSLSSLRLDGVSSTSHDAAQSLGAGIRRFVGVNRSSLTALDVNRLLSVLDAADVDSLDVIHKMGFEKMTPVQASTIPRAMKNQDCIVEVGLSRLKSHVRC